LRRFARASEQQNLQLLRCRVGHHASPMP
jgi:hypothetical protein